MASLREATCQCPLQFSRASLCTLPTFCLYTERLLGLCRDNVFSMLDLAVVNAGWKSSVSDTRRDMSFYIQTLAKPRYKTNIIRRVTPTITCRRHVMPRKFSGTRRLT